MDILEMMLESLSAQPYRSSILKRDDGDSDVISTVYFSLSKVYETAIKISEFNHGDIIPVGRTKSEDKANKMHDKWKDKILNHKEEIDAVYDVLLNTFYLKDTEKDKYDDD